MGGGRGEREMVAGAMGVSVGRVSGWVEDMVVGVGVCGSGVNQRVQWECERWEAQSRVVGDSMGAT